MDETQAADRAAYLASPRSGSSSTEEPEWGSDGLVSIQSARYGEFLGIVENADHWDTRGAQGFAKVWETDATHRGGWSEFFGWKDSLKNERKILEQAREDDGIQATSEGTATTLNTTDSFPSPSSDSTTTASRQPGDRERDQVKFSAALEWIADKVPTQAALSAISSVQASLRSSLSEPRLNSQNAPSPDKPPKFDLERFYIALARNLYEEGL